MLKTAGRAIVQCWPMLLIWFFAGWLAHGLLVRLAGWAGNYDALWGLLILPLAVLAKLASYVGMFLSVRPALTHFERLDAVAHSNAARAKGVPQRRSFLGQWGSTVLTGIVPFLVIYLTWGMIKDDLDEYARAAHDQTGAEGATNTPWAITIGVMSITFVVVAIVARFLIGRFAHRLPAWVGVFSAYLEAAWVITAVRALAQAFIDLPVWLASRRMFGWAVDGIAALREQFAWFAAIGDSFVWMLGAIGDVLLQPLAWLALAAIVYARALPPRPRSSVRAARIAERMTRRWRRAPRPVRKLGAFLSSGFRDRWEPIATALSLIWRTGPVQLGSYVLAFAVVTAGTQWLAMAAYDILGPHELSWWLGANDPINLILDAIALPIQIALVAAAFDRSLEALDEQVVSADAELSEVLPQS